MNIRLAVVLCFLSTRLFAQGLEGDKFSTNKGDLVIKPILHGTVAFQWDGKVVYVDPYGGVEVFKGMPVPTIVLITDIHGDHMDIKTLDALDLSKTKLVVPPAVADQLPDKYKGQLEILGNGSSMTLEGMIISAIPMYNLPEDESSRHTKGRGNGYVVTAGGKKVYFSGDTEDILEMRALRGIDVAFVCMNLPYTMDVDQAADAVLEFKPKTVYPYHYRGQGGLNDVEKFKSLVDNGKADVEVRLRNWYPGN